MFIVPFFHYNVWWDGCKDFGFAMRYIYCSLATALFLRASSHTTNFRESRFMPGQICRSIHTCHAAVYIGVNPGTFIFVVGNIFRIDLMRSAGCRPIAVNHFALWHNSIVSWRFIGAIITARTPQLRTRLITARLTIYSAIINHGANYLIEQISGFALRVRYGFRDKFHGIFIFCFNFCEPVSGVFAPSTGPGAYQTKHTKGIHHLSSSHLPVRRLKLQLESYARGFVFRLLRFGLQPLPVASCFLVIAAKYSSAHVNYGIPASVRRAV